MSHSPRPPFDADPNEEPEKYKAQKKARRAWVNAHRKKKARKGKKATNDNVEIANLEQYILSQNISKAADYYIANQNLFNYKTFRQVNGNGAQLVNKLRGIDNIDVFYKIKTSVLSLMRPKIRIYKVNYSEFVLDEAGEPVQGKIVALPQPCYKEFKFSDNFGFETAITAQEYLAYESTRPSWRNVGLESFSVKQDGKKHGVIENNIDCTLKLTFKSLKDIQASPPGEPSPERGGLRYVDLITWAPARIDSETDTYNPKHYEIKVLLGYTAPTPDQLRALNLSSADVEAIKNIEKLNVIVSLSLYNYDLNIEENGQVKLSAQYRGRLETTIGSNQVNIFQNTFRINRDGAVDISRKINSGHNISKVYKLRTTLNSINRELNKASCKTEECKGRKNLNSIIENDAFLSTIIRETDPDLKNTGLRASGTKLLVKNKQAMYEFFKNGDNIDKLQAKIKQKVGLYKKDVYKSFVDQLITGNTDDGAHGTRLFCLNSGSDFVKKSINILTEETEQKGVEKLDDSKGEVKPRALATNQVKIDRCHKVNPIDANIAQSVASEINSSLELESKSKDKKTGEKKKDPARVSVRDISGENHRFYFVYLGDIVELACKNAGLGTLDLELPAHINNKGFPIFTNESYFPKDTEISSDEYPLKHARMLLGPLEYYDNDGNLKTINLAQFPISFNFFRAWFLKKIVRRRRPQMPLGAFIANLINNLVMPALGVGMPKSFKAPQTRSSIVSMTLPGKYSKPGSGVERKVCGQSLGRFEEALPMRQVINVDGALFDQEYFSFAKSSVESESLIKTSFDYLLMYVTTHKNIIERRGDPAEDIKDGIYHFNIGSDMGLLKSMNFKRVTLPSLVELRSKEAESQGVDSLDQLKFPYDTDLKLIGTSLFTPGMFYYVNPSLAGLGAVEDAGSLAYKMNLGGYHLVQTVTTTISTDSFETTVEGTQTSQGRR